MRRQFLGQAHVCPRPVVRRGTAHHRDVQSEGCQWHAKPSEREQESPGCGAVSGPLLDRCVRVCHTGWGVVPVYPCDSSRRAEGVRGDGVAQKVIGSAADRRAAKVKAKDYSAAEAAEIESKLAREAEYLKKEEHGSGFQLIPRRTRTGTWLHCGSRLKSVVEQLRKRWRS
jgi:hypothetical protein